MTTPVLECRQLSVGYGQPLLPPIDLTVYAGQFWAVVGRNGSGKTTWFKTVLGLQRRLAGSSHTTGPVAYVPQRRAFDPLFPISARGVVAQGVERDLGFLRPRLGRHPAVDEALEAVGATEFSARPFRALSEGQKQRILLARMVASRPRLALLDEPTAAMDQVAEQEAMDLLVDLRDRYDLALMVVSHHLPVALAHADRVLFFDPDADAVVQGTPPEVRDDPAFQRRYGPAAGNPPCEAPELHDPTAAP